MAREPPRDERSCCSAHALSACGILVAYSLTLAPGITRGDSGDLATAAIELGVPHPTGYPLFILLAHLASRVPLAGEPIVRIEALNAVFAVAAAMLLALTIRRLSRRLIDSAPSWAVDFGSLLAAASVAFAPVLWDQVRIPEVYAMHAMLVSWGLFELVRFDELRTPGSLYRVALPIALGAAHHVTIVYLLAAAVVHVSSRSPGVLVSWFVGPVRAIVSRLRPGRLGSRPAWLDGWWVVWAGALTGALGLSLYTYSWWAANHSEALAWGATVDLEHVIRHATGRQYRRNMAAHDGELILGRLARLPGWITGQLLTTAFAAALGLGVVARRAWPLALTLAVYAALNFGHGLQYKVSDHANYYLPAIVALGLLGGVGLVRSCVWLLDLRARFERGPGLLAAGLFAIFAVIYAYYRVFSAARLSPVFRAGPLGAVIFAILIIISLGLLIHALWGRDPRRVTLHFGLCLLALIGASLPTWAMRLVKRADPDLGSERAYAMEVTRDVPPGGLYLTGGDSYAFPLWYYQHVLGEGPDALLVNVNMLRSGWYLRYLRRRSPQACDPYDPDGGSDCVDPGPGARSWFKVGHKQRRASSHRLRRELGDYEIVDGGQPECSDPAYREANPNPCKCWDFNEVTRSWDEECVAVAGLDGAVVRRSGREIDAHRLIADHIDERPVYERNVFTRWLGKTKNPRHWSGPAYNRISARYALLNRGRINQIVYRADVSEVDACGASELERASQPELSPPRTKPQNAHQRPRYEPNPEPALIKFSALQDRARNHGHEARRRFVFDEPIWLTIWWFERWLYAREAEDHRGPAIRHGVRICVFDPKGQRVHLSETITDGESTQIELETPSPAQPGVYTVQACTVGDLGEAARTVPASRPCVRTILEYEFTLEPSTKM